MMVCGSVVSYMAFVLYGMIYVAILNLVIYLFHIQICILY